MLDKRAYLHMDHPAAIIVMVGMGSNCGPFSKHQYLLTTIIKDFPAPLQEKSDELLQNLQ